jgi:hypothetical protein
MIQQSHSWGNIQRNVTQVTPEAPAHPCLLLHYSQQPSYGNNPRCSTTEEWAKIMWSLNTMKFYLAAKKNEILSFLSK